MENTSSKSKPCLICGADAFIKGESISINEIVKLWGKEQLVSSDALVTFYRCNQCTLEFADMDVSASAEWYEAGEWYGNRWEYGIFARKARDSCRNVIEVGCGEGFFLDILRQKGIRGIGIDINRNAIKKCSEKGLEAYCCGIENIANMLQKEQVDGLCLFHVVEHLSNPLESLREATKYLRSGAMLAVSVPSPLRSTLKGVGIRDFWDYPPHHLTRWNRKSLRTLFAQLGFEVMEEAYEPLSFMDAKPYAIHILTRLGLMHIRSRILRRGLGALMWLFAYLKLRMSGATGESMYILGRKSLSIPEGSFLNG